MLLLSCHVKTLFHTWLLVQCKLTLVDPLIVFTLFHFGHCCFTGEINSLNVLITTDKDIFFKIQHPSKILVPVQLYIVYIDANNPTRTVSQVSTTVFRDTKLITHFVPNSLVPPGFDRVQVMIALQHGDMQGPIHSSGLAYGRFYFQSMCDNTNIMHELQYCKILA